ncbi:MAG: ATP-binding cassette domain-containing protein [Oscillospiraceae bacterium]|jgi:ABC-type nitrate/sulfonate/bicarbonate transport system ATPase subunit|nr:ATP-binding cassette domain-containing protein [Oscillospiraceae bacterium]
MRLEVSDLSAGYGESEILRGVSFTVADGEFVAVLGASGCGKSTLLGALMGSVAHTGRVLADGEEIRGATAKYAYMPQDDLLLPWRTVLANTLLYRAVQPRLQRAERRSETKRASELLRAFGLAGLERRYPRTLSGGQRQRAAFARTAMCPAELLLLDEPFAALDPVTRGELRAWLKAARERLGRSALFVTHDLDEALYLCDRVLVLRGSPARIAGEFFPAQPDARERIFQCLT